MVGVPFLVSRWDSGPSLRIGWPSRCLRFSQRMIGGPRTKLMSSAVTHRPAAAEGQVAEQVEEDDLAGSGREEVDRASAPPLSGRWPRGRAGRGLLRLLVLAQHGLDDRRHAACRASP